MATTHSFNSMLNEYLHYELLRDEHQKRNYLMGKVERDNSWKGGPLIIPFEGGSESSMSMGQLTDENDISEATFVRGSVSGYKEIWGTLKFNEHDLATHSGGDRGSEQTFLKNLPNRLNYFMDSMKETVSLALLTGSHFAKLTVAANANTGVITVDHPERFTVNQKVVVADSDSTVTAYVKSIDINANTVVLVTTRGGVTLVDFSVGGDTMTLPAKVYIDGAQTAPNAFTSLRQQLLPASAGGDATIFGVNKLLYPYTQAIAIDGSTFTVSTILDNLFDAFAVLAAKGRGADKTLIVSYTLLGNIMKKLESGSGAYRHVDTKVSAYGYTEITITGVKGTLKIAGVHEMDGDIAYFMDWSACKFHTNGDFHIHKDPEGKMYYVKRTQQGYIYIVDVALRGEISVHSPWRCGVIHSIPTAVGG